MPQPMNWFNKKRNIILAAAIFIFAIFSAFTFVTNFVHAQNLPTAAQQLPRGAVAGAAAQTVGGAIGGALKDVAGWSAGILFVLHLISWVLTWLLAAANSLLNMAFQMALQPQWFQTGAVLEGWQLMRDLANVFFILIFLFVSIQIILRIDSPQTKKTVSSLILMAFLINFSLPISTFVIDVANVIAFQFHNAIGGPNGDIAINIANGLKLQSIKLDAGKLPQAIETPPPPPPSGTEGAGPQFLANNNNDAGSGNLIATPAKAFAPLAACAAIPTCLIIVATVTQAVATWGIAWVSSKVTGDGSGSSIFGAFSAYGEPLVSNILMALVAFVILSIAILVLIRTVVLMFVVITAPLGFIFSVLPQTKNYGNMWWTHLLNQSFFLPVVYFLLWVSLKFMDYAQKSIDLITKDGSSYASDPTNSRLVFFIMSLIMLYACLPIAKKMGAYGVDTLQKWFGIAQSAVTGFVGGVAARNLIAPIGGALLSAGVPQRVAKAPVVGQLFGVPTDTFAKWLSTRGRATDEAAAKAALGMTLAPNERPAYFGRLDRAGKEAMLRKMNDADRAAFLQTLSPQQQQIAQQILRSGKFTPEERAKFDLEAWKRLGKGDQLSEFARMTSAESREAILRSMSDDDRARFIDELTKASPIAGAAALGIITSKFSPADLGKFDLAGWKRLSEKERQVQFGYQAEDVREQILRSMSDDDRAKFVNGLGDDISIADRARAEALINSPRFTADEQKKFKDAQNKIALRKAELGRTLVSMVDGATDDDAKGLFKLMTGSQRQVLLEGWTADTAKLKKMQEWVAKMGGEDEEKFYNDTLKRAAPQVFTSYINALPAGISVAKERTIGSAPASQQAYLYDQWKDEAVKLSELNTITSKFSTDSKEKYYDAVAKLFSQKTTDEIKASYAKLPDEIGQEFIRSRKIDLNIELINKFDPVADKAAMENIFRHIEQVGQSAEYAKKLNLLYRVQYIAGKTPGTPEFENKIVEEIRSAPPKELSQTIDTKVIENSVVQKAIMENASIEQLTALATVPARLAKIREIIRTPIQQALNTNNKQTILDAITEEFERKNHNKDLADQLKVLWDNQLNGAQKGLKKRIFG